MANLIAGIKDFGIFETISSVLVIGLFVYLFVGGGKKGGGNNSTSGPSESA